MRDTKQDSSVPVPGPEDKLNQWRRGRDPLYWCRSPLSVSAWGRECDKETNHHFRSWISFLLLALSSFSSISLFLFLLFCLRFLFLCWLVVERQLNNDVIGGCCSNYWIGRRSRGRKKPLKKKREKRTDWTQERKGKKEKRNERKEKESATEKRPKEETFFFLFNLNTVRSTRRLVLNEMQ